MSYSFVSDGEHTVGLGTQSSAHWYYAGPYVPSGVVYDPGLCFDENNNPIAKSPSCSNWLIPGYERAFEAFGVINLYNPPDWFV